MSRTPSLAEVVREALEARLSEVHVCLPGRVVAVDNAAQTVDVQPAIKSRSRAGDALTVDALPVLPAVPYAVPRAGLWFVHMPIAIGDHVLLVFAERSLDVWRSLGGVVDPNDIRMHHLSDAIAMPCNVRPDAQALAPQAWANLVVGRAGGSTIHIKPTGAVALGSENPSDSVARASLVNARLTSLVPVMSALQTCMTALATAHTALAALEPISQAPAAAACTAAAAALSALGAWPNPTVGSIKVAVDP